MANIHSMDTYDDGPRGGNYVHMVDDDGELDTSFQNDEEVMNLMSAYIEYVVNFLLSFFCFCLVFFVYYGVCFICKKLIFL